MNDNDLRDDLDDADRVDAADFDDDPEKDARTGRIAGWGISVCIHVIAVLIISAIVFVTAKVEDAPPIKVVTIDTPPPPTLTDTITGDPELRPRNPVPAHEQTITAEDTRITDLTTPDIKPDMTEDPVDFQEDRGRKEAVAAHETGGQGVFMTMGLGGGAAGFHGRGRGGNHMRLNKGYGHFAKESYDMIDAALRWLVRHQSETGMWDSDNYYQVCKDGQQCEPGKNVTGADEAMTGYALLCFLGAGYDQRHISKYRQVVKKGLDWLLASQKPDGLIGSRNYEHAVAAMALAEAYGMTGDPSLKESAQKAVDVILARQARDPAAADAAYAGLGWDYVQANPGRMDSSVTGWNVMALKSAKMAGLDVKGGLEGSRTWLEGAWKAANPGRDPVTADPYGKSVFPYTWAAGGAASKDHLSFIGSVCAVFLGHKPGTAMLDTMVNDMNDRWLTGNKYQSNAYALYYCTMAAFQYGGETWEKWCPRTGKKPEDLGGFVSWLIGTQIKSDDCRSGTWTNTEAGWHGHDTSPVLIHCYKLLSAEVAFRYLPLNFK